MFRKPVGCCPWKGSPVRSGWLLSGSWTPFPAARPSCPRWEMRYCPSNSHIPRGVTSSARSGLFYPARFAGSCAQDRLSFDNLLIPRQFVYRSASCVPFFCTGNLGLSGRIGCASSPAHFLRSPVIKHRAGAN